MKDTNATTVDLDNDTSSALGTLREAFGSTWWANEFAVNGAVRLLTELAAAELNAMTPLPQAHGDWLVAHTAGVAEVPGILGYLLYQDIDDSVPELGEPGVVYRDRMRGLTVTQDLAIRMALARFHHLRRENRSITLHEVGIRVEGE